MKLFGINFGKKEVKVCWENYCELKFRDRLSLYFPNGNIGELMKDEELMKQFKKTDEFIIENRKKVPVEYSV